MHKIRRKENIDILFKLMVALFAFSGIATLIVMFAFILKEAFPAYQKYNIMKLYFTANYHEGSYGMLGALVLTLLTSLLATLMALPLALRCAFFVHFRLKVGQKIFTTIIHVLASMPSILFGIFAFYSLSKFTNFAFSTSSGQTLINGIIMLTFMVLPILVTMILNQLKMLPPDFVNSALALGSSKTHAIYTVVRREIRSGIIVATITALGRAIGETMALSLLLTSIPTQGVFPGGFLKIFSNNTMTLGVVVAKTFFDDVGASKAHLFAAGVLLFLMVMFLVLVIGKISSRRPFQVHSPWLSLRNLLHNQAPKSKALHYLHLMCVIVGFPLSLLNFAMHLLWTRTTHYFGYIIYYLTFPLNQLLYPWAKHKSQSAYFVAVVQSKKYQAIDGLRRVLEIWSIIIIGGFALWLMIDILYHGLPLWTSNDWKYSYTPPGFSVSRPGSIANPLVFTVIIIGIVLVISLPIALFTALYLSEYARYKRHARIIRFFLDALGGTPSILFGIFGSIFFIKTLGIRTGKVPYSLLAGALTMVLVVIPTFTRAIEQTILKVPSAYREAALALGSSRLKTIFKIIIPQARAGISASIILTSGRVIAETAPIYLTLGGILTAGEINWLSPGHTLTTEILGTFWTSPDFNVQQAVGYKLGAAAIVLSALISLLANSLHPLIRGWSLHKLRHFMRLRKVVIHG